MLALHPNQDFDTVRCNAVVRMHEFSETLVRQGFRQLDRHPLLDRAVQPPQTKQRQPLDQFHCFDPSAPTVELIVLLESLSEVKGLQLQDVQVSWRFRALMRNCIHCTLDLRLVF